jgi:hypothetical protein
LDHLLSKDVRRPSTAAGASAPAAARRATSAPRPGRPTSRDPRPALPAPSPHADPPREVAMPRLLRPERVPGSPTSSARPRRGMARPGGLFRSPGPPFRYSHTRFAFLLMRLSRARSAVIVPLRPSWARGGAVPLLRGRRRPPVRTSRVGPPRGPSRVGRGPARGLAGPGRSVTIRQAAIDSRSIADTRRTAKSMDAGRFRRAPV